MFDIQPDQLVSKTDKLLYNIWHELRSMNEKPEPVQPTREATEEKVKEYTCKTCGKIYGNAGKMLSCARKHKKEAK